MKKIFRQSSGQAKQKGSALVFALVVMFIILTAALGVASVSVIEQKNSSATGKSTQAFQVADSAVELVLKKAVTDPQGTTLASLGNSGDCNSETGIVKLSGVAANVSFKDVGGNEINGEDVCNTVNLSQVAEVKAVATYGDTTRAISAAVAAGTLSWQPVTDNGEWNAVLVKCAKDLRTGIVYLKGRATHSSSVNGPDCNTVAFDREKVFTLPPVCSGSTTADSLFNGFSFGSGWATLFNAIEVKSNWEVNILIPCGMVNLKYPYFDGISFPTN